MEKTYKNITDSEDKKMAEANTDRDWVERLNELNLTDEQRKKVDAEFNKRGAKDKTIQKYREAVKKAARERNHADIRFIGSMLLERCYDLREQVLKDLGYIK